MAVTLEQANEYFAGHLDAAYWSDETPERRTAALVMAERQIAAVARGAVVPEAVFEQAVYLLRNHAAQAAGRVVTAQSLDGVGSQSFQYLAAGSGRYAGISPEAVRLLDAAPRTPVRLNRG